MSLLKNSREILSIWEYELVKYKTEFVYYVLSALLYPAFLLLAISIAIKGFAVGSVDYLSYLIPGVLGVQVMYGSLYGAGAPFVVSKLFTRVSESLLSTPITYSTLVVGKSLAGSTKGLIVTSIVMGFASSLGLRVGVSDVLLLYPLLFTGGIAFSGLGLVIAMMSNTIDRFNSVANILVAPMQYFSAVFFPISYLPASLQPLVYVMPLTYLNTGIRMLILGPFSLTTYFTSLAATLGIGIFLLYLNARLLARGKGMLP